MPKGFSAGINPEALKRAGVDVKGTRTPRGNGKAAEDALYQFLDILGIPYQPQYPWGRELNPPRKFVSDAAILTWRVLIEVDGRVHGVQDKRERDLERQNLGTLAGWAFLRFTPEQARSGEASLTIQRFIRSRLGNG